MAEGTQEERGSKQTEKVYLSQLDRERFGVPVAKATLASASDLEPTLDFCLSHQVVLLIARCPTTAFELINALQRQRFGLMGTLLYYACQLGSIPDHPLGSLLQIRPLESSDHEQIRRVAAESFKGFFGHYHADPRLDRSQCDAVYIDWAKRSCRLESVADEVLVAVEDDSVLGFGTLRLNSAKEGEGVLFAVRPSAQKRGVLRVLIQESKRWLRDHGASRMLYSTQVVNYAAQKVLVRLGFEMSHSLYTFHRWFD